MDAFTTSESYPYSRHYRLERRTINYIRNSVKAVIDAYNGTTTFHVADMQDPILAVYRAIFPTLFRPLDDMPAGLRAHLRYPVDLFRVQAEIFATFHMQDSQVFYNKEDLWQLPIENSDGNEAVMEPYYTIMRLPGSEAAEMILMLPFTPSRKDNMIAWLAARCDGEALGQRVVYQFPKQELVYGPRQIEARIDQDAEISQELTLWSQRGSNVIRGNLLVIPMGTSVLYLEPLYLQAEKGALPELKRIIAAHANIAMEPTLALALQRVFGSVVDVAAVAAVGTPGAGEAATTSRVRGRSWGPGARDGGARSRDPAPGGCGAARRRLGALRHGHDRAAGLPGEELQRHFTLTAWPHARRYAPGTRPG
jgi:uncharacterized membrane protein (UPF0182 family)